MYWSRAEIAGWVIAVLGIGVMAFLVAHGPWHNINKGEAKAAYATVNVKIVTATGSKAADIGQYVPAKITVHVGQPITFTNVSNADHTVTDRQNAFNSGNIGRTQTNSWTYMPTKAGTFHYYCQYHPLMAGTLVVH